MVLSIKDGEEILPHERLRVTWKRTGVLPFLGSSLEREPFFGNEALRRIVLWINCKNCDQTVAMNKIMKMKKAIHCDTVIRAKPE